MKNTTTLFIMVIMIFLAGDFVFVNQDGGKTESSGSSVIEGSIQKVTLGFKDYNYYPNTIRVKEGVPVEITLDESIYGCYRSFTIRSFGVNAYSANPSEKITFTPNKKGTFPFSCSMGMGTGTLIVE